MGQSHSKKKKLTQDDSNEMSSSNDKGSTNQSYDTVSEDSIFMEDKLEIKTPMTELTDLSDMPEGDVVTPQRYTPLSASKNGSVSPQDRIKRIPESSVQLRNKIKSFRKRQPSEWDSVDHRVGEIDYTDYEYPFENIVLEGGGNKGLAYCGALKVLEEIGLSKKIKKIAGTSAGAMTAALFAVGYTANDIQWFLSQNIGDVFRDAKCGVLSLLPNLLRNFGWNPGNRIYEWFGEKVFAQTGDADFTFKQLYDQHGIELAIVVTNLNQMDTVYCHVKTSPDMPIRMAVRMSMAIPGMFAATRYSQFGQDDIFIDGGVLCNYPIHCFDGWWLSMEKEDGFFKRLRPLSTAIEKMEKQDRFGTFNHKTIGFLLYANHEQDIYRTQLESRRGVELPIEFPDTKLFKQYRKAQKLERATAKEHSKAVKAVDAFFSALLKHDMNEDQEISLSELEAAFDDKETFRTEHADYLFGPGKLAQDAFKDIVQEGQDKIQYADLTKYLEKTGIDLGAKFLGYHRREIKNFAHFLDTLQTTLLTNIKKVYMRKDDICRTVGINTGYIDTTDFGLEVEDRDFLVEQGRRSTVAFLKYYAVQNNLHREGSRVAKSPTSPTPRSPGPPPVSPTREGNLFEKTNVSHLLTVHE